MNQNFINKHLQKISPISVILYPLSLIYCMAMCLRRWIYRTFPAIAYKSKIKIISVGNITAGGSGKTPFTLFIAKQLIQNGKKIAIVLRGYKGSCEHTNCIVSSQSIIDKDIGDEATQYIQNLRDTPICIGKDRIKSIKILEKEYHDIDYIIMDDAFQHLKVKTDDKYCVINTLNPLGNGLCIPAGILREPLSTLKYADYIVINAPNNDHEEFRKTKIFKKIQKLQKNIIYGTYTISKITDIAQNNIEIDTLKEKKIILLSGIGHPTAYENTIKNAGLKFIDHVKLNDHFEYTQDFIDKLHIKQKYDYILTTEKDYTKIKKINTTLPILVVYVEFYSCHP